MEENKYHGGYFVLPQYRVAIDMRHGDILVCNVHEWHGNTALYETEEDKEYNDNDRWLICSEGRERLMTWYKLEPKFFK